MTSSGRTSGDASSLTQLTVLYEKKDNSIRIRFASPTDQAVAAIRKVMLELVGDEIEVRRIDDRNVQAVLSDADGGAWFVVLNLLGIVIFP